MCSTRFRRWASYWGSTLNLPGTTRTATYTGVYKGSQRKTLQMTLQPKFQVVNQRTNKNPLVSWSRNTLSVRSCWTRGNSTSGFGLCWLRRTNCFSFRKATSGHQVLSTRLNKVRSRNRRFTWRTSLSKSFLRITENTKMATSLVSRNFKKF